MYRLLFLFGVFMIGNCGTNPIDEPIWDTDIPPSEDFEAVNADWSSDGSKIFFQHTDFTDQNNIIQDHIWMYDFSSMERSSVLEERAYNVDIYRNGEKIVYHKPSSPFGIYEYDILTNTISQLTGIEGINEFKNAIGGKYSPNYSKILATVFAGDPRGIIVMDSSGANPSMIVEFGIMGNWFPSGEKIIYVGWSEETQSGQIFEIGIDGNNKKQLTNLEDTQELAGPVVSPNGDKVAFAYNPGGSDGTELFLLDYNSGEITQITNAEGSANRFSWSPNGDKISFNRVIGDSIIRLYVIDVNTLEVEPIFKSNSQ